MASVAELRTVADPVAGKGRARVRQVIDERIVELVKEVREKQERMAALESEIAVAKAELFELLDERGENWTDGMGYAALVSEAARVFYDRQALDHLILEDPLRYGWLKDFRREISVRGSVKVR
jgi:hypothetical protein